MARKGTEKHSFTDWYKRQICTCSQLPRQRAEDASFYLISCKIQFFIFMVDVTFYSGVQSLFVVVAY